MVNLNGGLYSIVKPSTDKVGMLIGIIGSYPEVVGLATSVQKIDYLRELVNSYLLKDILMYEQVKNSVKLLQL